MNQMRYYDRMWSVRTAQAPQVWPIWSVIKNYLKDNQTLLEIGVGVHPRIPAAGSYFVDISPTALEKVKRAGGLCQQAKAEELPFKDFVFDLVCAFDVLEHIKKDEEMLKEIYRILKQDGLLILAVPLHAKYWSLWDEVVGHQRRYEPQILDLILKKNGFYVDRYRVQNNSRYLSMYKSIHQLGGLLIRHSPKVITGILSNKFYFPLAARSEGKAIVNWITEPLSNIKQDAVNVVIIMRKRL